ncbi:MAG: glycosyltransferase family 4 protein [Mariprofundus sp.]
MSSLILVLISFVTAVFLGGHLCNPASRLYILDQPNVRSLHENPTPRGGGIAILAALGISWALALLFVSRPPAFIWIVAGLAMVAAVSFRDDHSHVQPLVRLLIQALAAFMLIFAGLGLDVLTVPRIGPISLGWFGSLLSILFVVWFINLYNFMDGMDGFAGGMGAAGFTFLAIIGWMAGESSFAILAILVAAANFGFLIRNFPPAKIFMGDAGSASMGFLAASFVLWGEHSEIVPLWASLLIFSPFMVDASVTLIRRLLAREKVWQAHRSHYYQRLVQLGWGHRKTVLVEYILMLATGVSAILLLNTGENRVLVVLSAWSGIYLVLAMGVHRLEARSLSN